MGKYDDLSLFTSDKDSINPEIFVSIANDLAESNRLKRLELKLSTYLKRLYSPMIEQRDGPNCFYCGNP